MKFFIPAATDTNIEQVYKAIKDFAKDNLGWEISDRKIFSIEFKHNGHNYKAEVGQITDINREPVCAILESNAYLVCTFTRGVLKNEPILVGKPNIINIQDFDWRKEII